MIFRKFTLMLLLALAFIAATSLTQAQPAITAINVNGINPTNANDVSWNVTFSEPVTGVTTSNFTLATSGSATGALDSATPILGNQTWTVNSTAVAGDGTLGVDLTDPSGINGTAAPLTQTYVGDLYTIDNTAPQVLSITRLDASPTSASTVNFAITFSEPVYNLSALNFSPSGTALGGTVDNAVAPTGDQSVWTASISGITGSGSVGLALTDTSNVTDAAGNFLFSNFGTGEQYIIDQQGPQLICITRLDVSPTSATSVTFLVEFDEPAANLQPSNFTINGAGTSGTISNVSPSASGTTWTVTANNIQGQGTLTVDLTNPAGITDMQGNPAGAGATGPGCDSYAVDRVNPEVVSIDLPNDSPTSASVVSFVVTFSEPVTTATLADFTLIAQDTTGTITGVITVGDTTTVTVSGVSGPGLLCLQVNSPSTITDLIGNPLEGIPVTSSCYIICLTYGPITGFDPSDGSTTSTAADFLRWTPPSTGLTFHVYFDGIFRGTTTSTAFAIPKPLSPGQHSYLIDIDGSCTSGTQVYFNVLDAPVLTSPVAKFASCIAPSIFRWDGVDGATTYTLYIDALARGITTGTTTVLQPSGPALEVGPHTWYVTAENEFGQRSSEVFAFTVLEDDANPPVIIRTNGTIYDVLTIGDDVYIGGDFDQVLDTSGTWVSRNNVASLSSGALVVSDWNPDVNGTVHTMELAGSSLLIGGDFTRINNQQIARIASIDVGTTTVGAFRPGANGTVRTIEVVGNTVYYGGDFTKIGKQVYNFATPGDTSTRLAIADLITGLPIPVNLNPNASVRDLLYDGADLYVAGVFSDIGGQPYHGLAQLKMTTTSTLSVSNDFLTTTTSAAGLPVDLYVYTMDKLGNTLYIGGSFNEVLGQDRRNAAAIQIGDINTSTSVTPWDPQPNSAVHSLSATNTGSVVYLGGTFTTLNNARSAYLVGVDQVDGLPTTCSYNTDRPVFATHARSSQLLYVGGQATQSNTLAPLE